MALVAGRDFTALCLWRQVSRLYLLQLWQQLARISRRPEGSTIRLPRERKSMYKHILITAVVAALAFGAGLAAIPTSQSQGAACSAVVSKSGAASDHFGTVDGRIYTPTGTLFIARGVNVYSNDLKSAATSLTITLPGVNFVRVVTRTLEDPATFKAFIDKITGQGLVVEFEHHPDGGGAQGTVYTGARLAGESAWYASMASTYKTNPYVWFGTYNEPPTTGGSLSEWQQATYNAIRGAGNDNPILLEVSGSKPSNLQQALDPSVYAKMRNVIWDPHAYNYQSNFSTDQHVVDASVQEMIAAAQRIRSADGLVPVIIGEYGNSTTGERIDPGGIQEIKAVMASGVGSAAFTWTAGIAPGNMIRNTDGSLTAYGEMVAVFSRNSEMQACVR
jgi:hypothetical protein